ncbi:MAG: class I SAM-dependent RNA methyltransferase [Myxococcales bacterium]|nr:class I SAM-dependent RNA methyltransferase [Myxococcales bacterium]
MSRDERDDEGGPARLRQGDRLEVRIEALSREGEGLARAQGREVVIAGAFLGERARARIVHVARQRARAFAALEVVEEPHPGRRSPPCPRHPGRGGACSGCPWMALEEEAQRVHKRRLLADAFGLVVDEVRALPGGDLGYRWSSKRVVGGRPGALVLGSYVRGTHDLADMSECLVEHPAIAAAVHELVAAADELAIEPYDEASGAGDLRYVWLKTDGREVLLTLITGGRPSRAAELLGARLQLPAGIAWSVQGAGGNALRGGAAEVLRGRPGLALELAGAEVEVGPLGFLQPNPAVAEMAYRDLVRDAEGEAAAGALALDLYAGAGVTTALLRRAFARVVPCESYPESALALGVIPMEVDAFLAGYRGPRPDLVIANPPRAGLGAAVCRRLGELAAPRVQIMSCAPATLADDLRMLSAAGYEVVRLRAYDTLPQTPHVEVVAWLRRAS